MSNQNQPPSVTQGEWMEMLHGLPRAVSAPPRVELSSNNLFSFCTGYSDFFIGDIRCDKNYESFYNTYEDTSKLPPPLEKPLWLQEDCGIPNVRTSGLVGVNSKAQLAQQQRISPSRPMNLHEAINPYDTQSYYNNNNQFNMRMSALSLHDYPAHTQQMHQQHQQQQQQQAHMHPYPQGMHMPMAQPQQPFAHDALEVEMRGGQHSLWSSISPEESPIAYHAPKQTIIGQMMQYPKSPQDMSRSDQAPYGGGVYRPMQQTQQQVPPHLQQQQQQQQYLYQQQFQQQYQQSLPQPQQQPQSLPQQAQAMLRNSANAAPSKPPAAMSKSSRGDHHSHMVPPVQATSPIVAATTSGDSTPVSRLSPNNNAPSVDDWSASGEVVAPEKPSPHKQRGNFTNSESATTKYTSVSEVIGRIFSLAKDQYGCRFLQKKLEEENPSDVQTIFQEVFDHIVELMTDPFGNYLCQKLVQHCNDQQRTGIIRRVSSELVNISLNMHGTRAVQKLIEYLSTPLQIQCVIEALRNSVVTLIKDLNGNHVIQRCLNRLNENDKQFIYDAVAGRCVEVATHRHGCCVLQRCIDFASERQKMQLVAEIVANALTLVQDPFGNYVVQYVLDLGIQSAINDMIMKFVGHIVDLSKNKFSSNVIEKCLKLGGTAARTAIIEEVLRDDVLPRMLQDSFANYVIQTSMSVSDPAQFTLFTEKIRPLLHLVRNTPYGKKIESKLNKRPVHHHRSPSGGNNSSSIAVNTAGDSAQPAPAAGDQSNGHGYHHGYHQHGNNSGYHQQRGQQQYGSSYGGDHGNGGGGGGRNYNGRGGNNRRR